MDFQQRASEAGATAIAAEERGDETVAAAEWHRYRLIRDAARHPEELLAEGIALSRWALELATASR